MNVSQESQAKSESLSTTSVLKPISSVEMAGVLVLALGDIRFLATLRSPHDAWYLFNVFLYVLWLIVTIVVPKYRWPAALRDFPATPFPNKSDGGRVGLGWYSLFVVTVGALFIHPAIAGLIAIFRWRGRDSLKGRQANCIALLIFVGYLLYSLAGILFHS